MKTTAFALAAVLAFSGAAFAKNPTDTGAADANVKSLSSQSTNAPQGGSIYKSKRFIDPQTTGTVTVGPNNEDRPTSNSNRIGGDIDPSVLPNF